MPSGYWWQCSADPNHTFRHFSRVAGLSLVRFFFDLAERDWDQASLSRQCPACSSPGLRIAYAFPRQHDPQIITVQHVVGINTHRPYYLPMLWEGIAAGQQESWYDLKYVGWNERRGYQSYGLARPAVITRSELKELDTLLRRVSGHDLVEPRVV